MSKSQPKSLREIATIAYDRHGVRGRGIERIADKAGYLISRSTFDKILAGTYTSRATPDTLEALAFLADLKINAVYEAAGERYHAVPFAEQLPRDIDLLTEDQRNALITVARSFINSNREINNLRADGDQSKEAGGEGEHDTSPMNEAPGTNQGQPQQEDLDLAARDQPAGGIDPGDIEHSA